MSKIAKTPNRQFKDHIYEQLARVGKALSSPGRLELLDLLCQGPRNVDSLANLASMGLANASKHLRILHGARLVETEREGTSVTYRLASQDVCELYRSVRSVAESRLAEIEAITRDFLQSKDQLEEVDQEELVRRVSRGEVVLLDVRPPEEYENGHIPGSLSIPVKELEKRLTELPIGQEIVAYCRGPYCVMSIDAVSILRQRGYSATRLEDGVPDWRARGLPVEQYELLD